MPGRGAASPAAKAGAKAKALPAFARRGGRGAAVATTHPLAGRRGPLHVDEAFVAAVGRRSRRGTGVPRLRRRRPSGRSQRRDRTGPPAGPRRTARRAQSWHRAARGRRYLRLRRGGTTVRCPGTTETCLGHRRSVSTKGRPAGPVAQRLSVGARSPAAQHTARDRRRVYDGWHRGVIDGSALVHVLSVAQSDTNRVLADVMPGGASLPDKTRSCRGCSWPAGRLPPWRSTSAMAIVSSAPSPRREGWSTKSTACGPVPEMG